MQLFLFIMIVKSENIYFESYLKDSSNLLGKANQLYIPESSQEFVEIIDNLCKNKISFQIFAGGTSTNGSSVSNSDVIISTELLNKIIFFNEEKQIVKVEAGLRLKDLQDYLKEKGYFLPPNPTETWSTIGGNVSTNASGSRSYKYGSIRKFVRELRIYNPLVGDIVLTEENLVFNKYILSDVEFNLHSSKFNGMKNSSGYFIDNPMRCFDLFIGAEGTLGILIDISLKVEKLPESICSMLIYFNELSGIISYLEEINRVEQYQLSQVEFYDNKALNVLRKNNSFIPKSAKYCLFIELECNNDESEQIEFHYNIISKHSELVDETYLADSPNSNQFLVKLRHSLPLYVNELISNYGVKKVGTDTAVPKNLFVDYFIKFQKLIENSGLDYVVFGHIGDCHLHANFLPRNEEEYLKAKEVYQELINLTVEYKGTVSAEHGIGKIKKDYFKQMLTKEEFEYQKMIKELFDKDYLFNKGNIF